MSAFSPNNKTANSIIFWHGLLQCIQTRYYRLQRTTQTFIYKHWSNDYFVKVIKQTCDFLHLVQLFCTLEYYAIQTSVVILLTVTFTRSSANTERPSEHAIRWNLVKWCTNGRGIAFEKLCNWWMTFKVIQGLCQSSIESIPLICTI